MLRRMVSHPILAASEELLTFFEASTYTASTGSPVAVARPSDSSKGFFAPFSKR